MTGFGSGAATLGNGRITIEIRALNHKHQDVRLRFPSELGEHAFFLEQTARSRLGRGRYDISVREEGEPTGHPTLDTARVKSLFASLSELHQALTPDQPLRLDPLLSLPDVLSSRSPDPVLTRQALVAAFDAARTELSHMRTTEGAALFSDLAHRLSHVRSLCEQVRTQSTELVEHHQQKLVARIEQLVSDPSVLSSERLEQEVALLADRSDITEEIVRLSSHFDQFADLMQSNDPVGRRLDFLLQEMGREVNTIGSKSQHAPTAHLVVEMKSEVERLREQVQNVA